MHSSLCPLFLLPLGEAGKKILEEEPWSFFGKQNVSQKEEREDAFVPLFVIVYNWFLWNISHVSMKLMGYN